MTDDWDPPSESLSTAGQRRSKAILAAALVEAGRRRRRRLVRRSAIVTTACGLIGVFLVAITLQPADLSLGFWQKRPEAPIRQPASLDRSTAPTPEPVTTSRAVSPENDLPRPPAVVIEVVRTDPTLIDRMAVPRSVGGWEVIGTDELLRQLDRIGLAGGVVTRNGKSHIWFRPAEVRHSPG